MAIVLDGTNGIDTPDLASAGPITGTTGTFSGAVQASGVATNLYPLVSGTAVASTSGTSIDFTSIPSWVKRITVMFSGVSISGTSNILFQLGDSGGVETTGYLGSGSVIGLSAASSNNFTTGFGLNGAVASYDYSGNLTICLQDSTSNTWVANGVFGSSTLTATWFTSGKKPLSATLDRVRVTTVNGTDTFDAGSINILYE
jgi:hypothetical protein